MIGTPYLKKLKFIDMKKFAFLTLVIAFGMISCNGNESAFSEDQKTEQDSLDKLKQENEFDMLESDSISTSDSSHKE